MSQNCDVLKSYRDKELLAVYDKTISKLKINSEGIEMLNEIKGNLLSESWWSTNDFSLLWAEVMRSVKFLSDKYSLLVGLSEKDKDVDQNIKNVSLSRSSQIDKTEVSTKLEQGFLINEISENALTYASAKTQMEYSSILLITFKKLWNYKDLLESYMQDIEKLAKDQASLKLTVQDLVKEIDSKSESYQKEVENAKNNLETVEQIKQGIDIYMTKNCKD